MGWPLVGLITGKSKILVVRALIGQPRILVCANDPGGYGAGQMDIPAAIDEFSE
jgi:hypothetical protein